MHPELGNSYVLTFYLTILKGKNNDAGGNLTKLYGIHKFDNLQFSFNVNENYENKGCRAIVPDIGTVDLTIPNDGTAYSFSSKNKKPWKVLIPQKCFFENKMNKIYYSFQQTKNENTIISIDSHKSMGVINFQYHSLLNYNFMPIVNEWIAKVEDIIVSEPITETIFLKNNDSTTYEYPRVIRSLFYFYHQLSTINWTHLEDKADKEIRTKIIQQYERPLLEPSAVSTIKDYYLTNKTPVKIKSVFHTSNMVYYYFQKFQETVNLSSSSGIYSNSQGIILPFEYQNWRGNISTKLKIKTITTDLILNISQNIFIKKSLTQDSNILQIAIPADEKIIYDFEQSLLISSEQVKWWYVNGNLSQKEYEKFILQGDIN